MGHKITHRIQQWENDYSREGGVAVTIDTSEGGYNLKFTPVNTRLALLHVKTKFKKLTIINAYAPAEDKDDFTKDQFHNKLEKKNL